MSRAAVVTVTGGDSLKDFLSSLIFGLEGNRKVGESLVSFLTPQALFISVVRSGKGQRT